MPPTSVIARNSSDLALAAQPLHCLNLHAVGFWRCYLSSLHDLIIVPSSGGRGAFQILLYLPEFQNNDLDSEVFSSNLPSYPLSSSTLHAIPELVQDEKDFNLPELARRREGLYLVPELARRREGLYLVPQLAQGVHLLPPGCTEDFFSPELARRREGLFLLPQNARER